METGHGCGHHLLGAGSFAAACAVKEYLEKTGKPGTVIFYGCPGEEGGAAKAFFAKELEFTKLDAALSWHPGSDNQVSTGSCMSCIQTEYSFKGLAAHAAGEPEQGRSALDAVEIHRNTKLYATHIPHMAEIMLHTGGRTGYAGIGHCHTADDEAFKDSLHGFLIPF